MLHSVVPQEEQEIAMLPALPGHCKVILSTNIAESSITIPDVRMVINTGLQRCRSPFPFACELGICLRQYQ